MRVPNVIAISMILLTSVLFVSGCGSKPDALSSAASSAGDGAAAAQRKVTRQDPITNADLNPALSQKQKDLLLSRKNK